MLAAVDSVCSCCTLQAIGRVRKCHGEFCLFLLHTPSNRKGKETVTASSVCSCCTLQAIGRVRKLSRRILSVHVAHSKQSEG